jgi:hypothetical protein
MSSLGINHATGHWKLFNIEGIHRLNSWPNVRVSAVIKPKSTRTGNKAHTERIEVHHTV